MKEKFNYKFIGTMILAIVVVSFAMLTILAYIFRDDLRDRFDESNNDSDINQEESINIDGEDIDEDEVSQQRIIESDEFSLLEVDINNDGVNEAGQLVSRSPANGSVSIKILVSNTKGNYNYVYKPDGEELVTFGDEIDQVDEGYRFEDRVGNYTVYEFYQDEDNQYKWYASIIDQG